MKIYRYILIFSFVGSLIIHQSCEELIEVDNPQTQLISETVFEDDLTASASIAGLYSQLTFESGGFSSITFLASMSADEIMSLTNPEDMQFFENSILPTNSKVGSIWQSSYRNIYLTNVIIEGLENSKNVTPALKNQLIGEAKFLRAFRHFYLVNLFGNIPYVETTDFRTNGTILREEPSEVYEKIIRDLIQAKELLATDYSYSKNERVRPNKSTATALLARAYLYTKNWPNAEEEATEIINTSLYSLKQNLNDVFLKNSTETIWQLIPPNAQTYTNDGSTFNQPTSYGNSIISTSLVNTFESGDNRKANWIDTGASGAQNWNYANKYKEASFNGSGKEYSTVLRLAEQFLIRAETRAMQNKLVGPNSAESDLNTIRNRAGLPNTSAVTQSEMLSAIEQERRVELFTEWGHRWLDLKRTNRSEEVLGSTKTQWNSFDVLYPIPVSELLVNPNISQNTGY